MRRKSSKPGKRVHKSKGITTGLGICVYLATLLELNEILPSRKRLSDRDLAYKLLAEFPGRKSAQAFVDKSIKYYTINSYRGFYNSGALTGEIPEKLSLRYNNHGEAVEGRKGSRLLLPEDILVLRRLHKEKREEKINGRQSMESV